MKSLQLTLLSLFCLSLLSAQVTFEADTVFLIPTGVPGFYDGQIAINSSSTDLLDLRWEQTEKDLEPLVWTGYVYSCDSTFFPFSTAGQVVQTSNTSTCFLGVNIVNLESDLPRMVNKMRLRVTSISDPNLDQMLTYILDPVPVSTREVLPANSVRLSPNPARDFLQVEVEENLLRLPIRCSLFNGLGQLVYFEEFTAAQQTINTSNLANGLYFLKVETEEGELVKRFVKEK